MKCKSCKNDIPDGSIFCNWCGERQIKERKKKDEIKVPTPRQLPSGKWFIQLRAEGQSVTEDTEALCVAKAQAIRAGFVEQKKKAPNKTLRQAIDDYTASKSDILSPATIRGYNTIRNNRFKTVMDKPIDSIRNWQKICNEEASLCSAKTLKNSWGLMTPVLRYNGLDVPDVSLPPVVLNARPWLDPDQIKIFVDAVHGTNCEIPALLALHGLRRSEICALTWEENIDLEKKQFLVSGAIVPNTEHKMVRKNTNKNASSRRYVPILIDNLYIALEAVEEKSGPVVTCNPNTIRVQVNKVCKKLGFPLVGTHGLRHSFASLAHHIGMPEKEAMCIGGWSNYDTMHKIYIHISRANISKYENKMRDFYKNT